MTLHGINTGLLTGFVAFVFSGCIVSHESVEVFDSGPEPTLLKGFTTASGGDVHIQVMTNTGVGRTDPGAGWATIATTNAGTTVASNNGGQDYYAWQVLVPAPGVAPWPSGGVARLRAAYAVGGNTVGYTFDDLPCLTSDASLTWAERGAACASHSTGFLHYVDASAVSASMSPYISRRETPEETAPAPGGGVVLIKDPSGDYYDNIDPRSNPLVPTVRETLQGWMDVNGFSAVAGYGPIERARYYNSGDLRLGRDMNCVEKLGSPEMACYVTNYGDASKLGDPAPGDDETPSLDATISGDVNGLVATVAMEYTPGAGVDEVRFYAFAPDGSRVGNVKLDQQGPKTMPGACLSCHGGNYSDVTHSVTDARFLPFDVDNFSYSPLAGFRLSDQQADFRALNKLVYEAGPTEGIVDLIEGWYRDPATGLVDLTATGPDQNTDYVPAGWAGEEVVYQEVVKPYCRGCHVGVFSGTGGLVFDDFAGFEVLRPFISNSVCETREMPHAEVTRDLFWRSAARGHLIGRLDLPTACN